MSTARHRAEYSRDSNGRDFKARAIFNLHGYIVGSFRPGNPYGKHSPNRLAI